MKQIAHQALKWLPVAFFSAPVAVASAWPSARDLIANYFSLLLHAEGNPWVFAATLMCAGIWTYAIIWTGRVSEPAPSISPYGLVGEILNLSGGGTNSNFPEHVAMVCTVRVRNSGLVASAAIDWFSRIHLNGEDIAGEIMGPVEIITDGTPNARAIFPLETSILTQGLHAIPAGGIINGHITCLFPKRIGRGGYDLFVGFHNISGESIEMKMSVTGVDQKRRDYVGAPYRPI